MTISVFNQLYTEKCWDDEYNILYPIWGKANREEEYVIFQKGNELRKCTIPPKLRKIQFVESFIDYVQSKKDLFLFSSDMNYDKDPKLDYKNALAKIAHCRFRSTIKQDDFDKAYEFLDSKYKTEHQKLFERDNWEVEKQNKMVEQLQLVRQLFIAI